MRFARTLTPKKKIWEENLQHQLMANKAKTQKEQYQVFSLFFKSQRACFFPFWGAINFFPLSSSIFCSRFQYPSHWMNFAFNHQNSTLNRMFQHIDWFKSIFFRVVRNFMIWFDNKFNLSHLLSINGKNNFDSYLFFNSSESSK